MSAEALAAIAAIQGPATAQGAQASNASEAFSKMVSEGLSSVNQQLLASEAGLQQLASGNVENLHQLMIQMQEAKLSFDLLMQVRSRLLEAYQDVMRMQI
ncbi:MAG: flagellar hook-basal body complex protein FliE [Pseudomonadota bacterium]|jgi:flagellar hook-basal body complex protein FliE